MEFFKLSEKFPEDTILPNGTTVTKMVLIWCNGYSVWYFSKHIDTEGSTSFYVTPDGYGGAYEIDPEKMYWSYLPEDPINNQE